MTRRSALAFLIAALVLLAAPPAAADEAETIAEAIAAEMRAEGYQNVQIERTLLGRIRITGETADRRREVVIDRGTGEILRDLVEAKQAALPGRRHA